MGQKHAAYDENGKIVGFYDSEHSPLPIGKTAIVISDDEWMNCLNNGTHKFRIRNEKLQQLSAEEIELLNTQDLQYKAKIDLRETNDDILFMLEKIALGILNKESQEVVNFLKWRETVRDISNGKIILSGIKDYPNKPPLP